MDPQINETSFLPSLNKVIKELKREENSLFNCINSINLDTFFVQQIAGLYPQVPVYANLRCGRWYTADPDGTCYFKSTDGHFGEWNFSVTRLNWHLALAASEKGGCLVVDATRRGKTFPVSSCLWPLEQHCCWTSDNNCTPTLTQCGVPLSQAGWPAGCPHQDHTNLGCSHQQSCTHA